MENKYYTPEIEEFHVGFEYEVFEKGQKEDPNIMTFIPIETEDKWHKFTYPDPFLGYRVDKLFEKRKLRVKYLDREDIESLGFTYIGALWFESKNKKVRIRKWKGTQIDIYTNWESNENNALRFRGSSKNKSELKRILKQLNIIE